MSSAQDMAQHTVGAQYLVAVDVIWDKTSSGQTWLNVLGGGGGFLEVGKRGSPWDTENKRQWQSLHGPSCCCSSVLPRDPSPYRAGPGPGPQKSLWRTLPQEFPRPLIVLTAPRRWSTLTHKVDRECRGDCELPQSLKEYFQINLHIHETYAMKALQEYWKG